MQVSIFTIVVIIVSILILVFQNHFFPQYMFNEFDYWLTKFCQLIDQW